MLGSVERLRARMADPFPNQELLDRQEVLHLLAMSLSAWKRFLSTDIGKKFPKPVMLGTGPKGRSILRWRKREVVGFIDLLDREK